MHKGPWVLSVHRSGQRTDGGVGWESQWVTSGLWGGGGGGGGGGVSRVVGEDGLLSDYYPAIRSTAQSPILPYEVGERHGAEYTTGMARGSGREEADEEGNKGRDDGRGEVGGWEDVGWGGGGGGGKRVKQDTEERQGNRREEQRVEKGKEKSAYSHGWSPA